MVELLLVVVVPDEQPALFDLLHFTGVELVVVLASVPLGAQAHRALVIPLNFNSFTHQRLRVELLAALALLVRRWHRVV